MDASFLLAFEQSLGNMANHVNSLANQIELLGIEGGGERDTVSFLAYQAEPVNDKHRNHERRESTPITF